MSAVKEKSETKDSEEAAGVLGSALGQAKEAMDLLDLSKQSREFLLAPQQEMHFQIPTKMGDGSVEIFQAFRVKWNMARGPAKGGLRFHPEETIDTVRMLAAGMAWKTAVMDLPLGGGKCGVICNPKEMSSRELEQVSRAYIRTISDQVGPESDVPAPDVYTDSQMMAWMEDEYEFITNSRLSGVVTGKPVELGGSKGRDGATARGGTYTVREACDVLNLDPAGKRVAIQGYGKAGTNAHKLADELLDMKVVAVSDSSGGIYNEKGLEYEDVVETKEKTGSVVNYPTAEPISNEELLELDVSVLYPAALENVITEDNADNIQADIVAELANNPSTPEANRIMSENGVYVIPDILCNAGG
ncbi:MAG: Glu/Leu/Phe/Val dehydrogenase, partial [bacterium]